MGNAVVSEGARQCLSTTTVNSCLVLQQRETNSTDWCSQYARAAAVCANLNTVEPASAHVNANHHGCTGCVQKMQQGNSVALCAPKSCRSATQCCGMHPIPQTLKTRHVEDGAENIY